MDAAGVAAVFQQIRKAVIERALGAELGLHLAGPDGGLGNHRNGRSGKTVLTDDGPLRIDVPRDPPPRPSGPGSASRENPAADQWPV